MPVEIQVLSLDNESGNPSTVLCNYSPEKPARSLILFFPGDLSDFAGSCIEGNLLNYASSLEGIAWKVASQKYSDSLIAIFRSTESFGGHSIFSNFIRCDSYGDPIWTENQVNVEDGMATRSIMSCLSQLATYIPSFSIDSRIHLIGFSKGCSVIFGFLKENVPDFLRRVDAVTLIDPGGHTPGNTFPFTDECYSGFSSSIRITLFSSPYQLSDRRRPWLKREIMNFVEKTACEFIFLRECNSSLEGHFSSINLALERLTL
jgi:hypothetical protein